MQKFEKGFFVGAATAAHQVEGNNIHSPSISAKDITPVTTLLRIMNGGM